MSKLASSFSRHEYKPRKRIRSVRSRLPLALPNADVFDEVASFLNVQESCGFVRTERAAHTCIAPILQKRAALYSPTKPTFHDLALVLVQCRAICDDNDSGVNLKQLHPDIANWLVHSPSSRNDMEAAVVGPMARRVMDAEGFEMFADGYIIGLTLVASVASASEVLLLRDQVETGTTDLCKALRSTMQPFLHMQMPQAPLISVIDTMCLCLDAQEVANVSVHLAGSYPIFASSLLEWVVDRLGEDDKDDISLIFEDDSAASARNDDKCPYDHLVDAINSYRAPASSVLE